MFFKSGKGSKKEALPLPLHVADLEASICCDLFSGVSADTLLVCGFLMMIWGSLRFSDAQRIEVAGLTLHKVRLFWNAIRCTDYGDLSQLERRLRSCNGADGWL